MSRWLISLINLIKCFNMSKIDITDKKVRKRIKSNRDQKILSVVIFPFWLLISIYVINNFSEWETLGYCSLLASVCYIGYNYLLPTNFNKVKAELIKEEEERLEKIEQERQLAELEKKRREEEERQFKINQERTGFKLINTYARYDKFDKIIIVSTHRDYSFKNQSCHLYSYEFDMPIFRLTTTNDLWGSIVGVFDDESEKFYLEFYFKSKNWEMGHVFESNNQPNCKSSGLDILLNSEKYTQNTVELLKDDKDISQMGKNTCITVDQIFRFEVELNWLKQMAVEDFEMRFSNFPNVFGKSDYWEFDVNMKNQMKNLIQVFINDMS